MSAALEVRSVTRRFGKLTADILDPACACNGIIFPRQHPDVFYFFG